MLKLTTAFLMPVSFLEMMLLVVMVSLLISFVVLVRRYVVYRQPFFCTPSYSLIFPGSTIHTAIGSFTLLMN